MRWYPWLRPHFDRLVARYQAGKGHHALLLHALPGMGEDALSYALGRWLMCQHPEGNKSCGRCHSCQLMQAGTHPDYRVLEPEKGKSALGIEPVRALCEKLHDRARMGGARVVWLPDTDALTEAAANALLKTLEEPPENCWFLMCCREPERLPATLRSRCLYWHLAPPDENFAIAWLAREHPAPEEALRAALRLSAGAPGAALTLLTSDRWKERETLYAALDGVLRSGGWLDLLGALNHESVAARLHWLSALLLDAVKWHQGITQALVNDDQRARVAAIADAVSIARLQSMLWTLFRVREQLITVAGVNRELILTGLLLGWEHLMRPGAPLPAPHL
ncbi:DNA polymerase III subunit delta' [Erwinia sp. CPCC 100877]|nr:DNA polymerase III subunit delta' [Erwinia sp. CPCC 100877]